MRRGLAAVAALLIAGSASATTWDEPWQKDVAIRADTLGLFEVVSVDRLRAHVRTLKTLAGEATPEEFDLSVDSEMHYTSLFENEKGELALSTGQHVYLWPHHDAQGWTLPTPSSGIGVVQPDGSVAATYRISVHQALQSASDYEALQPCIFRHFHKAACDETALRAQLDDPLHQPPAALSPTATPEEQTLFFRQHVALEGAYLLGRDVPLRVLEPFLRAGFFHTQLSAVRALAASRDPGRNARLLAFVQDSSRLPMAQAMAVMMAKELGDKDLIAHLKAWAPKASKQDSRLPIEIMDPRIGTAFPPTVKEAIDAL